LSRDITEAIEQLVEYPERTDAVLRILNSRLRPLGVRLELIDSDRLVVPAEPPPPSG
jgi:hypothetical protein